MADSWQPDPRAPYPGDEPDPYERAERERRRQNLLFAYGGVVAALVIGIVILSIIVLTRDDDPSEVAATDDATPTPVVTPTPEDEAAAGSGEDAPDETATPTPDPDEEEEDEEPEFPPCESGTEPDPAVALAVTGVNVALNQRAAPSIDADLAGTIPVGTKGIAATGRCALTDDGIIWWEINWESGTEVWASANYLAPEAEVTSVCPPGRFDQTGSQALSQITADVDGDGGADTVFFWADEAGLVHAAVDYADGGFSDAAVNGSPPPGNLTAVGAVRPVGLDRDIVLARGSAGGAPTVLLLGAGSCRLAEVAVPNSDGTVRVNVVEDATGGSDLRCQADAGGLRLHGSSWAADAEGAVTETTVEIELGVADGVVVGTAGPLQTRPLGPLADLPQPPYSYAAC